jgi:hypothetical protein
VRINARTSSSIFFHVHSKRQKVRKIGIVVIGTNAYFPLGIKFIKRFSHFNVSSDLITFYFFSDTDPSDYIPDNINVHFIEQFHENWVLATNSKFNNIVKLESEDIDYIYYFDADTNVDKPFNTDWFIGDLVGGEHYGNRTWMKERKAFDRNPKSKAYIPLDTDLPQMYYYGAFFGGIKNNVINFCKTLRDWQIKDKEIPYEPGVNDESYINAYFHYNPPHVVTNEQFAFCISDKSGIGETRNPSLDISNINQDLLVNKNNLIDIKHGKVMRI